MAEWNEYDLLSLWESANGTLHPKWKKVFLKHQAVPDILKYPFETVKHLMSFDEQRLDLILKDLVEIEEDKLVDIRKESLTRTPLNNLDIEEANPGIISWDEESSPPFI
ncbi:MAG: hypothetical protein WCQ52_07910 [Actinomycetes bacterium]